MAFPNRPSQFTRITNSVLQNISGYKDNTFQVQPHYYTFLGKRHTKGTQTVEDVCVILVASHPGKLEEYGKEGDWYEHTRYTSCDLAEMTHISYEQIKRTKK